MELNEADRGRVEELIRQGLCLQAYRCAESIGPLEQWTAPSDRMVAVQLAQELGGGRRADAWVCRAWRAHPSDWQVAYHYALYLIRRRGPLEAWEFLSYQRDPMDAPEGERADWLALQAVVFAALRDFDRAEQCICEALDLGGRNDWLYVEQSVVLAFQNAYEQSLAAARRALDVAPGSRAAIQASARALMALGRSEEAVELLSGAARRLESCLPLGDLVELQIEHGRYEDARRGLERFAELAVLLDKHGRRWLATRRARVARLLGDPAAADLFEQVGEELFVSCAQRLRQPGAGRRRVVLNVPAVRQHHRTCAPATLAAISQYWSVPADHLGIAEGICYDGTTAYAERHWAEEHGFAVREFTVSWDAAVSLIDRGVAFTLTTARADGAHAQAVVGYDEAFRTFLLRDPSHAILAEVSAEKIMRDFAATGPRGMAMVPADKAALLEGLNLPEAELCDRFYEIQEALEHHRREWAEELCRELEAMSDGSRLGRMARLMLAVYDGDSVAVLRAVESLLELYPQDQGLIYRKALALGALGRRDEQLDVLARACRDSRPDPALLALYGSVLGKDAREARTAERLLRRALRAGPPLAVNFDRLAGPYWAIGRSQQALALWRHAACLGDVEEPYSMTYFRTAVCLGQVDEALQFLRKRCRRLGDQSGRPAVTLCAAYGELQRTAEARAVLEDALRRRPGDSEVLSFAAGVFARQGSFDRARALLEEARDIANRRTWLIAAATVAECEGKAHQALALWQEVLELSPLSFDAHRAVARLLEQLHGPEMGIAHFRQAVERFPRSGDLLALLAESLRNEAPAEQEAVLRRLLEVDPAHAWARRELALRLTQQGKYEEAEREARLACQLAPGDGTCHAVLGTVLLRAGRADEAREAFRQALRASADGPVMRELLETCSTAEQTREALQFIREELLQQPLFGEQLAAYRQLARDVLTPEELLEVLQEFRRRRPEAWPAWSVVLEQLTAMDRPREAVQLARQAAERFATLPGAWLDLAELCGAVGDREGQLAALRKAVELAPADALTLRRLGVLCSRCDQWDQAERLLRLAVHLDPCDSQNHTWLAQTLWKMGRREEAVEHLVRAVELDPAPGWRWGELEEWSGELGRPGRALEVAGALVRRRPADGQAWLALGRLLGEAGQLEQAIDALERAVVLEPRLTEAYDLRAALLAQAGRFEEALAACRPAAWGEEPPLELRAQAAWVLAAQGRLSEGISAMEAVLETRPNYYWGLSRLCEWYAVSGRAEDCLRVAQRMLALTPRSFLALSRLADAEAALGRPEQAEAHYRRALEILPSYPPAARGLFLVCLWKENLAEARELLEGLREHIGGPIVTLCEVDLAAAAGDSRAARASLTRLCTDVDADPGWLEDAVGSLVRAGYGALAERTLRRAAEGPEVHPHLGRIWAEQFAAGASPDRALKLLKRLYEHGEAGTLAAVALAGSWARVGRRSSLKKFIRRFRRVLREDVRTWSAVGGALVVADMDQAAVKWMSDYRSRSGVTPSALFELTLALRCCGRFDWAHQVSLDAIALPADETTPGHQLWLAWDYACAGEYQRARKWLAELDQEQLTEFYVYLYGLVQAMLAMDPAMPGDAAERFDEARGYLKEAQSRLLGLHPRGFPRKLYRRSLRRVAEARGGLRAWLWKVARLD